MRKLAMLLAGAAGVMLLLMVVTAIITGATQERHEHFMASGDYAMSLLTHAKGLRILMGLDVAFSVLYTLFFATLAMYLREVGAQRVFIYLGLGAMVLTGLLDMIEDHHIISLLEASEHGVLPADSSIAWQAAESSVKFSVSYFSLVAFGLAIPRTTKLGYVLCLFLTVGTLLTAVIFYAAPPQFQASLESGRWIGFLAGFLLAIAWLRQQPQTP